jgi:outer membrane lipoprotein-sorting protein
MMENTKSFHHDELLERAVDAVLRDPIPGDLSPEQVAQLVAIVQQAADQPCPITVLGRIRKMRPITKIAVAASLLIVLAGLLSWLVPGTGPARAFADVAEAINGIRTATWKVAQMVPQPGDKPMIIRETGLFMAPYKERTETLKDNNVTSIQIFDGQKEKSLALSVPLKCAIVVDLKKTVGPHPRHPPFVVLRESIAEAKKGKGGEVQHLGFETIDGHRTEVFLVRSKVHPDMQGTSETKLWVDPKTSLPVRVLRTSEHAADYLMSGFHYDVPLAPDLFSLEAPKGYYVKQEQLDLSPTCVAEALGIVAKYNGGVFPPNLTGDGGIDWFMQRRVDELFEKHGIELERPGWPRREDMEKYHKLRKADIEEIQKAMTDLSTTGYLATVFVNAIGTHGEWHYAGEGVKLNAPARPIFWYKIGNYCEVIYADLSIKTVSPQDVPKVPESEGSSKPQGTKSEGSR